MMVQLDEWTLDGVGPLAGVTFLAHLDSWMGDRVSGPLPQAAQTLPDELLPGRFEPRALPGMRDVTSGAGARGDEPLVAAAAVLGLVRGPVDPQAVHRVAEQVDSIDGPAGMDRFLAAVAVGAQRDRDRLGHAGRWLCVHGTRRRMVKTGLALLGGYGSRADRDLIMRLGLLEELSLYAVVALKRLLDESEASIFELAQQIGGWGRIQAIRRLNGSTDERVRTWLLRGGADVGAYLTDEIAFTAAMTGGLLAALTGDVDDVLLDNAGVLLAALASGGPAEDMFDYADGPDAIALYVKHIRSASPTLRRVGHVVSLRSYLQSPRGRGGVVVDDRFSDLEHTLSSLLSEPAWQDVVITALHSDDFDEVRRGLGLAERIGIDSGNTARTWLERKPHNPLMWSWLFRHTDTDHLDELLQFAYERLPMDRLASGPDTHLAERPDDEAGDTLRQICQRLLKHPGIGWPFIEAALTNRSIGVRNTALRALNAWPTDTWPPEARTALTAMQWKEPDTRVRQNIRSLLNTGHLKPYSRPR